MYGHSMTLFSSNQPTDLKLHVPEICTVSCNMERSNQTNLIQTAAM